MITNITIQFMIVLLIMTSLLSSLITMYLPKIKRWYKRKIKTITVKFVWNKESLEEKIAKEVKKQLMEILQEDKK